MKRAGILEKVRKVRFEEVYFEMIAKFLDGHCPEKLSSEIITPLGGRCLVTPNYDPTIPF
jgi:hypothetical protein